MTKKIRFGISTDLHKGFSEAIQAASDNAGQLRFEVISLERIEVDPANPRELQINIEDVRKGLSKSDPNYLLKNEELERLQTLADTIKNRGLINPIVVYKYAEKYRLVAGERRFLASVLIGKRNIQARILHEKPKNVELRLLQWIENNEREDLNLKDRIGNLELILTEYKKENPKVTVTATILKDLISISLSQAAYYMAILNAPDDIKEQIKLGKINNLDKAAVLAKVAQDDIRKLAITACVEGLSLKQLRSFIDHQIKLASLPTVSNTIGHVKKTQRINMGSTANLDVIKKLVQFAVEHPTFSGYKNHFSKVNWSQYSHATKAFRMLINILERKDD